MKYTVVYNKTKNKKTSKQEATFFKIEDATIWEKHVLQQGASEVKILVNQHDCVSIHKKSKNLLHRTKEKWYNDFISETFHANHHH